VSHAAKREYLLAIHARYQQAARPERTRILDEFCQVSGYHRKSALRLLNGPSLGPGRGRRRTRPPTYGLEVIRILKTIWEAAGYPWSLRLKALLPLWLPWAQRRFAFSPHTAQQLLAVSPRQMDRRLAPYKRHLQRRLYGHTKPGTLLKHHIPLKTERWDVSTPGFTEIDLVSHSGDSGEGEFIHSLNLTDIHTTWVERRAVMGKGQAGVRAALEEIRQALPFPLQGIDSDNGSEFINDHLYRYCQTQQIQFTRGRPYKKDDNAHVEQKNWTHVRKLLGYVRYDSPAALTAINALYRNELLLFHNLFLPSVKLVKKVRVGARVRRVYARPQTPLERVEVCRETDPRKVAELQALRQRLDPFQLAQSIDHKLERLYALAHHRATPAPKPPMSQTEPTPVEHQAIEALTRRFGIPVYVGKAALTRATRK